MIDKDDKNSLIGSIDKDVREEKIKSRADL